MTMLKPHRRVSETPLEPLGRLERTVAAMVTQLGVAMETLSLMRADQLRMLERLGMDGGMDAPHRCVDSHEPKVGGRRG